MTNDRNYLRMMHDSELTRYAQDNVRTELEFVLLERLESTLNVEEKLEALQILYDRLVAENNALRDDMAANDGATGWSRAIPTHPNVRGLTK
jgi:hypothetical protein